MRLWLKQRFAHLILAPAPSNPLVRRWQKPLREVRSVTELTHHWESGAFAVYNADPHLTFQVAHAIHKVNPHLLTELAVHKGKVYAEAKGVPMWTDLDTLTDGNDAIKHMLLTNYGRALNRTVDGVRVGDLVSALSWALRLRDDTEYLDAGEVKLAPVSDPYATGAHALGSLIAHETAAHMPEPVKQKIKTALNEHSVSEDEIVEARRRIEAVKEVLFGKLQGRWEHFSFDEVKRRLKEQARPFFESLFWLAEFLHRHKPELTDALGLTDKEGNLRLPEDADQARQFWNLMRDRLIGGGHGIKGRPTAVEGAEHVIARREHDRKSEPSLFEAVFKSLSKKELSAVVSPFKQHINSEIPQSVKDALSPLVEADLPDDLRLRVKSLIEARTWRDAFSDLDLAEAFQSYLYTLTQYT